MFSKQALITITPPLNCLNGILVIKVGCLAVIICCPSEKKGIIENSKMISFNGISGRNIQPNECIFVLCLVNGNTLTNKSRLNYSNE